MTIRFHAFEPTGLVGFDSVRLTFDTAAAVSTEPVARPGVDASCAIESLYPNPSNGTVTASWRNSSRGPSTLRVIDTLGRVRLSTDTRGTTSDRLDVDHLPPGVYMVDLLCSTMATPPVKLVVSG
ncbi:MAG: T9SS type A sorting domain-containing protein [Rhodothermales bacterium]